VRRRGGGARAQCVGRRELRVPIILEKCDWLRIIAREAGWLRTTRVQLAHAPCTRCVHSERSVLGNCKIG